MNPHLNVDRPTVWIAGGVGLLAAMLCLGLGLASEQRTDARMVVHTIEVDQRLATVLSRMQDAETGSRGFYVTGQDEFLAPYQNTLTNLGLDLNALGRATADDPRQRRGLARLRTLTADKMAEIAGAIALRRTGSAADVGLSASFRAGRPIMDAIRREIEAMRGDQAGLLVARQARADATFYWMRLLSVATLLLVGGMTTVALRDNRRRLALVTSGRDELARANAELVAGAHRSETAESQVRQMQKMEAVGQLTGGIAHDFNNMLAVVIANLDLARRMLRTQPDKAEVRIDSALQGARRAATLTARLLAFARQQPLAPVAMDPNMLVVGMSDLMTRTLGEQVRIQTVLAGGLWRIKADASQLENSILNLCVNARDAMADGGRLMIETSNATLDETYARLNEEVIPGQYVLLSITDSGIGMAPEIVSRAFDPFYTTKAVGKGTGLGLSQVFGFMKQSGGHVKLYSEPGSGTSVKIYLPRWTGDNATEAVQAIPVSRPTAAHSEVILVVEDDVDVQLISVDALRYLGYAVLHASTGEQALELMAQQSHIDLLFTDIVMPGINGRVLAQRASLQWPEVKVLYTTGYTRNAVVHNGVLDEDVELLPKPFTIDQLALKVRQVLDVQGAIQ